MTTPDGTHPVSELSAFVDGELGGARRAEVAAHLAGCSACAALAADLRGLAGAARALTDRPPASDLWPAIRDRIAASDRARVIPLERPGGRGRPALSWTQLAAAAVAFVVIGAGSMWLVLSGRGPAGGEAPRQVAQGPVGATGDVSLAADFADQSYDAAIADLEAALEASRDQLEPETVRTIEQNLRIIDQAITDTRRALAADPNSVYLSAHLAEQMQRKLDVLRTATRVATTTT